MIEEKIPANKGSNELIDLQQISSTFNEFFTTFNNLMKAQIGALNTKYDVRVQHIDSTLAN